MMTNADLYIILRRHAGHQGTRVITRDDRSVALLCDECNQIVMSADAPAQPEERMVSFHLLHEPDDPDPDYRWQCRVTMAWVKDEDGYPRQENGHGRTADEALELARAIAAAFMFEREVSPSGWPANDIDHVRRT